MNLDVLAHFPLFHLATSDPKAFAAQLAIVAAMASGALAVLRPFIDAGIPKNDPRHARALQAAAAGFSLAFLLIDGYAPGLFQVLELTGVVTAMATGGYSLLTTGKVSPTEIATIIGETAALMPAASPSTTAPDPAPQTDTVAS